MERYFILLIVITSIIVGFLLISLLISIFLALFIANPIRVSREKGFKCDKEKGWIEGIEEISFNEEKSTLSDGYVLHWNYSLLNNSNKFIILVHGYGWTREGMYKYGLLYRKLGYNLVTYDLRGHGDNKRCPVTMGLKDSKDLHELISIVREKFGKDIYLGIQGESMGAATALMEMKYDDNLKFVIEDCGYATLRDVTYHRIKRIFHLPTKYVEFAGFFLKMFYKYSLDDVLPMEDCKNSKTPLLIIHGDKDDYVPIESAYKIKDSRNKDSITEIVVVKGAGHARSLPLDKDAYLNYLQNFLNKIA